MVMKLAKVLTRQGCGGGQVADPGFLTKLLPCMGSPGVRLVHTPPGFSNVAPGADVFNQVRPQLWLPPGPPARIALPLGGETTARAVMYWLWAGCRAAKLRTDTDLSVALYLCYKMCSARGAVCRRGWQAVTALDG